MTLLFLTSALLSWIIMSSFLFSFYLSSPKHIRILSFLFLLHLSSSAFALGSCPHHGPKPLILPLLTHCPLHFSERSF